MAAQDSTTAASMDTDARLAEVLEGMVLQSAEIISARHSTGVQMPIKPYSSTRSFADLGATLRGLAFEVGETDPWRILGIPKFEGPIPTKDLVEARVREGETGGQSGQALLGRNGLRSGKGSSRFVRPSQRKCP